MKPDPIFPPHYLDALTEAFFGDRNRTDLEAQCAYPLQLAGFTAVLGTHLLWYGGKSLVRRIHNHFNPPPPPAPPKPSPSLRGTPSPEDIQEFWDTEPRDLHARLRIGSRLADLEPTLDNTFVFKKNRAGRRRIAARQPGLKGWLRKNTSDVKYSTAMHYKKLATRLRQLVGLDARIPLEWLLPGADAPSPQLAALEPTDRRAAAAARKKLLTLLAENPKYSHLVLAVEQKLGIMRMVTIRRIQPPKPGRSERWRKRKESPTNPLVSRVVRNGLAANIDEGRSAAFWDALRRILGERNPDPETRRLQSDIRAWLNEPLQARQNRYR
ncbi:MAG: hypothetical protein IKQ55_12965 [Kiritimatiellae bacterium]|nr:hypothetical protein [Kiritimatiellia bacterium]